ncbi:hypothetical protein VTN96DRAFT_2967 [Rasamsonia emersonii]
MTPHQGGVNTENSNPSGSQQRALDGRAVAVVDGVAQPAVGQILLRGVGTGYLLIEYIEETRGKMLSSTWFEKHEDVKLRTNFFRDLSRILLSLARIPLPRIGSFVVDNDGFLQLTNRPLTLEIQELENEEIATDIPRDYTYLMVDSYITDVLAFHDNRLRYQPNAINDTGDYIYQASALSAMRAIFPLYFQRKFRRRPFIFTLTDLHQSNIFIDKDWHIVSLVDLEWACSQPIEMFQPPYWLTNKAVDQIDSEEYDKIRTEFLDILAAEEERSDGTGFRDLKLSSLIKQAWKMGTFWCSLALSSPTDHGAFHQIMPWYWAKDVVGILARKLSDRKEYDERLRKAFDDDVLED